MHRKYEYTGQETVVIPAVHREVSTGDVIETDQELNNPYLKLIEEEN